MFYRIVLLTTLFFSVNSILAENKWKLELEKEGIRVYTRTSPISDFKEFKGETVIKTSVAEIEKILTKIEKYPEWCYKTTSATTIDKDSTTIRYFLVTKTPVFLKTRVACFEFRRQANNLTGEVIYSLNDIKCTNPISDDRLLIPVMKGFYKLTPAENGNVLVTMQMLTEPGGIIPSWLANLVVVDSPFVTLRNLTLQVIKNREN
jgi:hypothetical protein